MPPPEKESPAEGETGEKPSYEVPQWTKESARPSLVEQSKFATLFPKYLENYLQSIWSDVSTVLKQQELEGKLNLIEGSLTVFTTTKTWDPYSIIKARDFIKLLSRSVPLHQAQKIFQDDITYDIIKISSMVRHKERFVKRRQRLIGPNAQTLKALELLTDTYVLVQGNTVSVMGHWKGCKAVRNIVTDCMGNIHPIYGIKQLLIKRELAKDPNMKNEDWSRFVPQFRKVHQKKRKMEDAPSEKLPNQEPPAKKARVWKEKKPYTAFPPEPTPRLEDKLMESGEYWKYEKEKQKEKVWCCVCFRLLRLLFLLWLCIYFLRGLWGFRVVEQRPGNDTNSYVFVTCAEALRDSEDAFSFASNERFHRTSMGWEASEISDAQLPAGCSVQQSSRHACVPAALRHILCLHRRPCGDPCSVVKENHASYICATPSPLTDGDTDRCRCSNPIPHSNTPACSACVRVASLCG